MRYSKKGVTLVELVICCAIIVMLGGACTAVLASGSSIFNTSTATANAQLDADVLQTYLMNLIPSASNVSQETLDENDTFTAPEKGSALFIQDGTLAISVDGKVTTIRSVTDLEYELVKAGSKDSSRAQFCYKATLSDGSTISGGFVLSNVKYTELSGKVTENPFCFNLQESSNNPSEGVG